MYVWELYLKSGGSKSVEMFKNCFINGISEEYSDFIKKLHEIYSPLKWNIDFENELLDSICKFNKKEILSDTLYNNGFDDFVNSLIVNCNSDVRIAFEEFSRYISCDTTILTFIDPEKYVPYYFKFNFNVLNIIAEHFKIDLPEIPKKAEYHSRMVYYDDLCKSLHRFRNENEWSPYELFAFLYDFAPKYIGGTSSYLIDDLPEPKSAFFIGGDKSDNDLADNKNEITIWQCNPDIRVGDMVVMYLRTPISSVDSIWRSCSVGFIDPFFYYYRCTYICTPKKIKAIPLSELQKDEITKDMSIVRKNMQGINGVELKPSEYNHIVDIGKSKALKLNYVDVRFDNEFSTEKEVEDRIIKPLLSKLGFSDKDYIQQLYIEFGNHNHAMIPDFVLLPKSYGNYKSAFAVVEAKRSIVSEQQLDAAKSQVRSYAKILGAEFAVVISQEKIWVYSYNDDYIKIIFSESVTDLSGDVLYKLKKVLGK